MRFSIDSEFLVKADAKGREAKAMLDGARESIAKTLGCLPQEIYFTSCGTESDNWAIQAAIYQNRHVGSHIVTTAIEHNAVLEGCRWMEQQGYEVTYVKPDGQGNISGELILGDDSAGDCFAGDDIAGDNPVIHGRWSPPGGFQAFRKCRCTPGRP